MDDFKNKINFFELIVKTNLSYLEMLSFLIPIHSKNEHFFLQELYI